MNLNFDKSMKKSGQVIAIVLVIILTIVLGGLILNTEKPKAMSEEHEEHSEGEGHSEHDESVTEESAGVDKKTIEAHEKQHAACNGLMK